jgi:cytochrome c peroxidase
MVLLLTLSNMIPSAAAPLTTKQRLGRNLFFDTNLSTPAGQSCASCHAPERAFTDPDRSSPTSAGANPDLRGSRNAPTAMYMAFSPRFHFDADEGLYLGGQFIDGRAPTLKAQAKGPFLNPIEMANGSPAEVVEKVRAASYAPLVERVYGAGLWDNATRAYDAIADAIAAFERSEVFNRFTSRYDYFLYGQASLTTRELRGRALFEAADKGNCAACHPSRPTREGGRPLFTDFSYDNLGVPRNPANPFYRQPAEVNPDGFEFVDEGLGGVLKLAAEKGKMKVPTLRNIARTAPYMHNGYFKTLRAVVDFYNTRDVKPRCLDPMTAEAEALAAGCWPAPEVTANVNHDELGDLGLTEQEVDDIVAFLKTLNDGYGKTRPTLRN